MLKVIKHISYEELKKLYRKAKKASLTRRYLAILKMYEGKTVPKVAEELYVTPQIVQKWVHKWNEFGSGGLLSKPQSVHPPILKPDEQIDLIEEIISFPRELGYDFSHWTLKAVKGHIKKKNDKEISISGACRMIKRNEISRVVPRPMLAKRDPKRSWSF